MRTRRNIVAAAVLLIGPFAGCKRADPAPTELNDLARYLYRSFEDPEALASGLENLVTHMDTVDIHANNVANRSWQLASLQDPDVDGLTVPTERDIAECDAVGIAYASPHPIESHPAYMVLSDITPLSSSAVVYDRSFDVDDPDCFLDRTCEVIRTVNQVEYETTFFKVAYRWDKDFRWVEWDGRLAIVGRGWLPESASGENGNNHIHQNYELDVYLQVGDEAHRFYGFYADAEYSGIPDDMARSLSLSSGQSSLERADAWLDDNL